MEYCVEYLFVDYYNVFVVLFDVFQEVYVQEVVLFEFGFQYFLIRLQVDWFRFVVDFVVFDFENVLAVVIVQGFEYDWVM